MKVVNYMNFVRLYDPRMNNDMLSEKIHYDTTVSQLELAKEFNISSTFLLQYDAFTNNRYIELFKNEIDENTEIGVWFEVVRPLIDKLGLEWRGNPDWKWDWKVIPGFLMAYTLEERKMLIDEMMSKFRKIFGFYPKTVASWLIDTYSAEYLSDKYNISALAICRDQVNTDAYTLVGGYFNQAYYPSVNNIFTPAQTLENQINTPVFRLLGPDPVHNYDHKKYIRNFNDEHVCFTLEPVWGTGRNSDILDWFFDTYYKNENLGFSYAQIGQENSFGADNDIISPLRMQIEKLLKYEDVKFMTMQETGEWFKSTYTQTPATAVIALNDWDTGDEIQSVYYDCKNYTVNVFRNRSSIFIRCMYLFDEKHEEMYLAKPCETWDATYENLPVVDTIIWKDNGGIVLDSDGQAFSVRKIDEGTLCIYWKDKEIILSEDEIIMKNVNASFITDGNKAGVNVNGNRIEYKYQDVKYCLDVNDGKLNADGDNIKFDGDNIRISFNCMEK